MPALLPQYFGRYVLLKLLGAGAMGDVHLARPHSANSNIPSPIVIKRLHADLSDQEEFVKRFLHEAEFAVSVDSPNVARVYDVGNAEEFLYLTAEYIAGWGLNDVANRMRWSNTHAKVPAVVDMIVGGLTGLEAIHTATDKSGRPLELVHRDISGRNMMVDEGGRVRVIDFGLSKSNFKTWETAVGATLGSLGYMPPEQARGDSVDKRADIYAMGAAMYELLTNERIVKNGSIHDMLLASMNPVYPRPSEVRGDVPKDVEAVLMKAMAKDPAQRFDSAHAFADALNAVVPPSKRAGTAKALVEQAFGADIADRRAEVAKLLELTPSSAPPEVHTVSIMRREGVRPITDDDLPPLSSNSAWLPPSLISHLGALSLGPLPISAKPAVAAPPPPPDAAPATPVATPPLATALAPASVSAPAPAPAAVTRPSQPAAAPAKPPFRPGIVLAAAVVAVLIGVFGIQRGRHKAPQEPAPATGEVAAGKLQALLDRAAALRAKLPDDDPGAARLDKLISDLTFDQSRPGSRALADAIQRAETTLDELERARR